MSPRPLPLSDTQLATPPSILSLSFTCARAISFSRWKCAFMRACMRVRVCAYTCVGSQKYLSTIQTSGQQISGKDGDIATKEREIRFQTLQLTEDPQCNKCCKPSQCDHPSYNSSQQAAASVNQVSVHSRLCRNVTIKCTADTQVLLSVQSSLAAKQP